MTKDEGMTKTKTARDEFDEAFWKDDAIPVVREEPSENRVYDLEERNGAIWRSNEGNDEI